jgi:hypothetical protein
MLARFEREARTATRLRHLAIVRVLEAGQFNGRAFMAMAVNKRFVVTCQYNNQGIRIG